MSASIRAQRLAWLAASVFTGVVLAAFYHNGHIVALRPEVMFILKSLTHPHLYQGDPTLPQILHTSFHYDDFPALLGRILHWFGVQQSLMLVLQIMQTALWASQLAFIFLAAEKITGKKEAAGIATLLFAWFTPLLYVVASANHPTYIFNRSLGLALTAPSFYAYFSNRKNWAWLLAIAGVYVHPNPNVFYLMLYGLCDLYQALKGREKTSALALRILMGLALLSPMIYNSARDWGLPPDYLGCVMWRIDATNIITPGKTNVLLFIEGIALIWMALRAAPSLPQARVASDLLFMSAIPFLLNVVARLWLYPNGLPLGSFLVRLTVENAYFTPLELLGLIVAANWLVELLDQRANLPLAAILTLAVLSSQPGDYALRTWCLLILALWTWGSSRARRLAKAAAFAGLAVAWLWQGPGPSWQPSLCRWFHLRGGLFDLPFFDWRGALLLSIAVLAFWLPAQKRAARVLFSAFFLGLAGFALRQTNSWFDEENKPFNQVMRWFKDRAPMESHAMLPVDLPIGLAYVFMVQAERSAFLSDMVTFLDVAANCGHPVLPYLRKAEALGYDFQHCGSDEQVAANEKRMRQNWSRGRLVPLARQAGITHIIMNNLYDPLSSMTPVYKNEEYKVYLISDESKRPIFR